MATRVRSFSKINLGLAVGAVRADGFHPLRTVYQTLALHDVVTVTARRAAATTVRVVADHPGVPCSERGDAERNTAWKMVDGALRRMGVAAEVTVEIAKRLPVQGGLGAGSANAAAALLGLERELGRALGTAERLGLAAEVGSDVPLFLLGGTVWGTGRGEEVSPLPESPAMACVVAVPAVGVSTAAAFAALDGRGMGREGEPGLTSAALDDRLTELSRVLAGVWTTCGAEQNGPSGITRASDAFEQSEPAQERGTAPEPVAAQRGDLAERTMSPSSSLEGESSPLLALVRTGIANDFEEVVFAQHPSLRSTKRELMGTPGQPGSALYAALSGSGSALFGLYESRAAASEAQRRVERSGVRAILTETLPRREYWHRMFAESSAGKA